MSMSVLQLKDYSPPAQQPETAPPKTGSAEKLRKQPHQGFAATVAVGLALAGLYVGGRIFNARRARRVAPAVIRVASLSQPSIAVKPATEPPIPAPVNRAAKPKTRPPVWSIVNPRPGETYLQVA